MTIETYTEPENFRQIKRQLMKLEIVEKVSELTAENSVSSELLLVKVYAKGIEQKNALLNIQVRAKLLTDSLKNLKKNLVLLSLLEQVLPHFKEAQAHLPRIYEEVMLWE